MISLVFFVSGRLPQAHSQIEQHFVAVNRAKKVILINDSTAPPKSASIDNVDQFSVWAPKISICWE